MPYIHPQTWRHGVIPLAVLPPPHRHRIAQLVAAPQPPARVGGAWLSTRAWWEWHWTRRQRLVWVEEAQV